jgi:asparagine synthase (glutamine-hydrolysing)
VTLGLPGNPDAVIAAELSRRYGLAHEVLTLAGVEELTPEEADRRCVEAAEELECMADPLAHAALAMAEARAQPGVRISGLGGEVARGFYYFGRPRTTPVTRQRVERVARWRMFTNESVPTDVLDPDFASWAREFTIDEVFALSSETGRDWMSATDDFYLYQRMQRWAGVTGTAVCFDRSVINPMLDDRFIGIARSLAPRDKRNSMFLSRLQVALDEELAQLPLDGRPPPITYATTSLANSSRQVATTVGKMVRKARQRAMRTNRPPAGAEVLAGKVVEHWRSSPAVLDPVRQAGVFRDGWIDELLAGSASAPPSAVALMTNLRVAGVSR